MTKPIDLPPLPDPAWVMPDPAWVMPERMAKEWAIPGAFSAAQMNAYATAAVLADRAAQPVQPAAIDLRDVVDEMCCHQLTGSKAGMTALQNLIDTAWRVAKALTDAADGESDGGSSCRVRSRPPRRPPHAAAELALTADAEIERLRAALQPFADVGGWFFARQQVLDETPVIELRGINDSTGALTRGQFKAASAALRDLSA